MIDIKKAPAMGEREPLQNGNVDGSIIPSFPPDDNAEPKALPEYIEDHFDVLEELADTYNISCPRCENAFARVRKTDGVFFCPTCSGGKSETLSSVAAAMGWDVPPVSAGVPERRLRLIKDDNSYTPISVEIIESGDNPLGYALTDLGNAERFTDRFSSIFQYDRSQSKWLYWDGMRWNPEIGDQQARHAAMQVARAILGEAMKAPYEGERKALASHAFASERAPRIEAMLSLARYLPMISTSAEVFDNNPDILNCQNGIINLVTGELSPHDPSQRCIKIAPVDFDPNAQAPRFFQFLDEITCGREDLKKYLQLIFGYAATGHAKEQKIFIFVGSGENGKGIILRIIRMVLGEYSQTATPSLIINAGNKSGAATPEIARLKGVRLLEIEETNDGDRLQESRVKWLTGEDTLTGRHLYEDQFDFTACFSPILVTNSKPRVTTGGYSLWRRLKVIPFDFTAGEKRDKNLIDKLQGELPGILNWIVEGAKLWYANGLTESPTVTAASNEYKATEDRLLGFIQTCTVPTGSIHRADLYHAYERWAAAEGEAVMSVRAFNAALRERGYSEIGYRVYGGISLKEEVPF
jgi:putative DNA primase/helicase